MPETVAPVTLVASVKTPEPLTLKPVPTETPPTALEVATGRSAAARATVPVMSPWALNVIPDRVAAVIVLLIPRFPLAILIDLSRLEEFNFAGVISPSFIFAFVTASVAIFASITALLAIAPASTALLAKAFASTAFAAS